ncbi:MAG: hypothetical protein NDJ94_10405 [Vicinamibacteria bacterium]|nr:hypothetical protein [Vicinamibacteria bacterium]
MTARRGRGWRLAGAGLLMPSTAHAHLVNTGLGPLYDGMSHFVLTPEDFVPALAFALLAGQRGPRAGRLALLSLHAAWTRIAIRVAGSWIAASGLPLLGWALRSS